jgi:hypothetical protein
MDVVDADLAIVAAPDVEGLREAEGSAVDRADA